MLTLWLPASAGMLTPRYLILFQALEILCPKVGLCHEVSTFLKDNGHVEVKHPRKSKQPSPIMRGRISKQYLFSLGFCEAFP